MSDGSPDPVDVCVGERVRVRRMQLAMSHRELGYALGISFQQVQKYEKGVNRISASKLHALAKILAVPIAFFFEDAATIGNRPAAKAPNYVDDFLSTDDGRALARSFQTIRRPKLRRIIVHLVEDIAETFSAQR
jgi:transcriptional regulator with XRE-family HTH domain